ncbi:MAG: hypothetical protein ACKO6N_18170 [Myxococcota bacterium]
MSVVSLPQGVQACLERLASHRGRQPGQVAHFQRVEADVRQQLQDVGLVHGTRLGRVQQILMDRALRSKQKQGQAGSLAQVALETEQQVCTSAGLLYPERNVVLIFRREAEEVAGRVVEATPFDSGHFWNGGIYQHIRDREQRQLVYRAWCLPAPGYRDYFVARVASCFEGVEAWRSGAPPLFSDPDDMLSPDSHDKKCWFLDRSFEVRFEGTLPLDEHMAAIFLPFRRGDARQRGLRPSLEELERLGVELHYIGTEDDLKQGVLAWLGKHERS